MQVFACLQVARLPEALPRSPAGRRPVPSFYGVTPLPANHSLYSSTLSQLSMLSASQGQDAQGTAQMQVEPSICLGSACILHNMLGGVRRNPAGSQVPVKCAGCPAEMRPCAANACLRVGSAICMCC